MGTPMLASGPSETWLFELGQLQQSLETLLRLLGSLSFQLKDMGKIKKLVLHALSNKDLPDMKELPDSLDCLLGLLELLTLQVEETERIKEKHSQKKKKNNLLRSLGAQLQGLEEKKQVLLHALSQKDNTTSVALQEMSDAHPCVFPAFPCTEKLPDSIKGLLGLLGSLTGQVKGLEIKKEVVLHAISKFHSATSLVSEIKSDACPTAEDVVIVFVEVIEKANQYFDFEGYLKRDNLVKPGDDAFEALKHLVYSQKVQESPQFNKLDFQQIMDAVQSCIWNLSSQRHCLRGLMQHNTSSEAFPETENDWYSLMWPQEVYVGGLMEPLLSLVYYIREKGHVMDENPLVELSFMINFSDMFYKIPIFRRLLRKYSENSVSIHYPPLDFEEADIKAELSVCGKIESVRFERLGTSGARIVHVIFENSVAAKFAPLLEGWKSKLVIKPTIEEYEYQPKDITEYRRAMTKYEEFRKR